MHSSRRWGRSPPGRWSATASRFCTSRPRAPISRWSAWPSGGWDSAEVILTDRGIALELAGERPLFLARGRLLAVDQSTVAIDRVVEKDGLVRLTWRISDDTVVDTYLRPQDSSARALADALGASITSTGADA